MSNKTTLLSFFGSYTLNVLFCSLFHAIFSLFIYFFVCLLLVISLFKMATKPRAEVLSSVPKCDVLYRENVCIRCFFKSEL